MVLTATSHCSCSAYSHAEAIGGRLPTAARHQSPRQCLPLSTARHGCTSVPSLTSFSRRAVQRRGRQEGCRRRVAASGDEELASDIQAGTKVRVKKAVTVYHSPKLGDFNLEGQEGTVKDVVQLYKGAKLSANLPYKVEFAIPQEDGAKPVKLIAHLAAPEIEAV